MATTTTTHRTELDLELMDLFERIISTAEQEPLVDRQARVIQYGIRRFKVIRDAQNAVGDRRLVQGYIHRLGGLLL